MHEVQGIDSKQRLQRRATLVGVLPLVLLQHEACQPDPLRPEAMDTGPSPAPIAPVDFEVPVAEPVKRHVARRRAEVPPRDAEVDAGGRARGSERGDVAPVRIAVEPARLVAVHRAGQQPAVRVRDQRSRVALADRPEAFARRAGTLLGVRREEGRRQRSGHRPTFPRAREQEPVVVRNLGHRADGRARIARRRPLADGHRWREAGHRVELRVAGLLQEPARVGREALREPVPTLRVERVERERRLSAARHAGDDGQPVGGNLDVDLLQVVGRDATESNAVSR